LFKIAAQGVSLWYVYVYMYIYIYIYIYIIYYNPNCFISSIFLLFTLVCFLWWFQQF
jgi:hypothetical protein